MTDKALRGLIIAVSGPSGVGKGTVLGRAEQLIAAERPGSVGRSISATTRQPRGRERDGVEYYFKTKREFEDMISAGEIIEYDMYVDNYYGTPAGPVADMVESGKDVFFDITIEGSLVLKRRFPDDCVTVFLLPPSYKELEDRLTGRGTEDKDKIARRMAQARVEIARAGEFEYIVSNHSVEQAAQDIIKIIDSEKLKAARQKQTIKNLQ